MSHKDKKCLKMQSKERFEKMLCLGRSKHQDKLNAIEEYKMLKDCKMSKQEYVNMKLRDKIYSVDTYSSYEKHLNYFFEYCEKEHRCKTLKQCRNYVNEWLEKRIKEGLSAYTLKLEASALGKLYQEPTSNFIELPVRERKNITRSRQRAKNDYGFSLENNKEIINFCRGTGLRRNELKNLKKEQLFEDSNGDYWLSIKGKGGKLRNVLIIGPNKQEIIDKIKSATDYKPVWESVPSHMDVHSYRSDYATAIYTAYAKDLDKLQIQEKYYCKGDRKGTVLDRRAMLKASQMLGHNRLNVVASHYIR